MALPAFQGSEGEPQAALEYRGDVQDRRHALDRMRKPRRERLVLAWRRRRHEGGWPHGASAQAHCHTAHTIGRFAAVEGQLGPHKLTQRAARMATAQEAALQRLQAYSPQGEIGCMHN